MVISNYELRRFDRFFMFYEHFCPISAISRTGMILDGEVIHHNDWVQPWFRCQIHRRVLSMSRGRWAEHWSGVWESYKSGYVTVWTPEGGEQRISIAEWVRKFRRDWNTKYPIRDWLLYTGILDRSK